MLVRDAVSSVPDLEDVLVEGEISNLRMPGSGHLYFTLKDARAALRCVCFRSQAQRVPFRPENGMRVIAHGRVDVYEQDGSYQLYVDDLQPAGVGALAVAVEQVRRRLEAEGLFDPARKRPLPLLPRRVAVVTSPSGAAVRDVCTVLRRRAPQVGVVVVPTPVQGDGAAYAIVAALRRAQDVRDVDTVLLVRGGGSFEDLYAFQDETLARAVRASRVPVVTGIGHETDFTIADFAADVRAATPSQAAEIVVPSLVDLQRHLLQLRQRLDGSLPDVGRARQALKELLARLATAVSRETAAKRERLEYARGRLDRQSPVLQLPQLRQRVDERAARLDAALRAGLDRARAELRASTAQLQALSPLRVLARGYSLARTETGAVVTSALGLRPGQRLVTVFADGLALGEVLSVEARPVVAGEEMDDG